MNLETENSLLSNYVPSGNPEYDSLSSQYRICNVVGATPGNLLINGSDYIIESFSYYPSHLWRNFGILMAFGVVLYALYMISAEYIKGQRSKGEILIFPRGSKNKKKFSNSNGNDIEGQRDEKQISSMDVPVSKVRSEVKLQRQEGVFQWVDVCYDIKIKVSPADYWITLMDGSNLVH